MKPSPEVAIIGAGMAGLAAARVLVEHGVAVEIFEATDRLGGRVQTLHEGDAAVELGPEFVHGQPEVTLALAHHAGVMLDPIDDVHHVLRNGRLVPMGNIWQRFGAMLEGVRDRRRDESARAFLDNAAFSDDDAKLFAMLVEGFDAAPLDAISIASIAADASTDPAHQYRVRGGYGRLVDWLTGRLARGQVTVHQRCFVHAIDWSAERVRIEYRRDDIDATTTTRHVIVTVPIGVLQSGTLRFWPGLGDHAMAIDRLAMGQATKVVLCLRQPVWRAFGPRDLEFVHAGQGIFPSFWLRSRGETHQLTAWAGGPHARAIDGYAADVLAELAIDAFTNLLAMPRAALAHAVRHYHVRAYDTDPSARGAYSYTRVGGVGAASVLARPMRDRLFFAGEATSSEYEGTVAGALASGERAATQLLRLPMRTA